MTGPRLPILGITVGALLAVGSLLALIGESTPADSANDSMSVPATQPTALTGILWVWERTEAGGSTTIVPNPANYTIQFLSDDTGGIRADCNIGNLEYVLSGTNGIDITLGVSTLVACAPGSLDTVFRQQLEDATTYELRDGNLLLGLAQGGSMVFAPMAAQPTATPAGTPEPLPTTMPPAPTIEVPVMPRTGAKD